MIYRFRTSIHAMPPDTMAAIPGELAGKPVTLLQLSSAQQAHPLPISFESAAEQLQQLPRMFLEADGAFVWVGQHDSTSWQLDGCLYDHQQQLVYVEMAGSCPSDRFDEFLGALHWPEVSLIFQLPEQAAFISESDFRRIATAQ